MLPVALPPAPDARFAMALYCNPTCDDAVTDALEAGLTPIAPKSGFPDSATRPIRMMGIAGTDFGIPDADFVAEYGVDVDRPEALAGSQQVLLAWFAAPRSEALTTFAIAHDAFASAARQAGGWVEDLDTQTLYGNQAWAAKDPRGPITDWFVVDAQAANEEDGSGPLRLVTRGLRRYGDIELVATDVDPTIAGDVSFVLNAVAETLHAGTPAAESLPIDTTTVRGTAALSTIEPMDTDPEAPLVKVSFTGDILNPDAPKLAVPVAEPVPATETEVASVEITPAPAAGVVAPVVDATPPDRLPRNLVEAQTRARRRLDSIVRVAWDAGLPSGAAVAVSAPFKTKTGGSEYLWVELRSWEGQKMTGVLTNDPYAVPDLHKGDTVTIDQDVVFDYVWKKGDGTREGNTTAPFLKH